MGVYQGSEGHFMAKIPRQLDRVVLRPLGAGGPLIDASPFIDTSYVDVPPPWHVRPLDYLYWEKQVDPLCYPW